MSDKLTTESIAAIARGFGEFVTVLRSAFPTDSADELIGRAKELEENLTAQELLLQVIALRKLKLG